MTTVALVNYKDQIEKESPGFDRKKFIYRLDRTEYEKDFGTQYTTPALDPVSSPSSSTSFQRWGR